MDERNVKGSVQFHKPYIQVLAAETGNISTGEEDIEILKGLQNYKES